MQQTDKPFGEAIQDLLSEREWSIRELARHTKEDTGWGAVSTVHFMVRGDIPLTKNGLEAIARAFRLAPEYFAEYRMLQARESLDPTVVGFHKALRNLDG